ncbi:hypothetical protein GEMRC1_009694 [Eukaryota sp. GEM-RC1]
MNPCRLCQPLLQDLQSTLELRESELSNLNHSLDTLRCVIQILQRDNDALQHKLDSQPSFPSPSPHSSPKPSISCQTPVVDSVNEPTPDPSLVAQLHSQIHQLELELERSYQTSPSQMSVDASDTCQLVMMSDLKKENDRLQAEIGKLSREIAHVPRQSQVQESKPLADDPKFNFDSSHIVGLNQRVKDLEDQNKKLKNQLKEQRNQKFKYSESNDDLAEKLSDQVCGELEKENLNLLQKLTHLAEKLEKNQDLLIVSSQKFKDLSQKLNNSEEKSIRLSHEVATLATKLAKLRQSMTEMKNSTSSDNSELFEKLKIELQAARMEYLTSEELRLKAEQRSRYLLSKFLKTDDSPPQSKSKSPLTSQESPLTSQDRTSTPPKAQLMSSLASSLSLESDGDSRSKLLSQIEFLKEELASTNSDKFLYEKAREYWNSERETLESQRKSLELRMKNLDSELLSERAQSLEFEETRSKLIEVQKENESLKKQISALEAKCRKYRSKKGSSYEEILIENIPKVEVDFSSYLSPSKL